MCVFHCDCVCVWTFAEGIPIVFEQATYFVNEQSGSVMICAVAPDALNVAVSVSVDAVGGTALGKREYGYTHTLYT